MPRSIIHENWIVLENSFSLSLMNIFFSSYCFIFLPQSATLSVHSERIYIPLSPILYVDRREANVSRANRGTKVAARLARFALEKMVGKLTRIVEMSTANAIHCRPIIKDTSRNSEMSFTEWRHKLDRRILRPPLHLARAISSLKFD